MVGVRTEKTEGNFLEVAVELRPVRASMLNRDQYHSIIRELGRPAVHFEINFYQDPDQTDKGYMTIYVKPLDQGDRWALVKRMVTDEGQRIDGMGVPIRDSDQTRWLSSNEVYRLIRDGQRASSGLGLGPSVVTSDSIESLDWDEAADRLITFKDWQAPVLLWQSASRDSEDLLSQMWGKKRYCRGASPFFTTARLRWV